MLLLMLLVNQYVNVLIFKERYNYALYIEYTQQLCNSVSLNLFSLDTIRRYAVFYWLGIPRQAWLVCIDYLK